MAMRSNVLSSYKIAEQFYDRDTEPAQTVDLIGCLSAAMSEGRFKMLKDGSFGIATVSLQIPHEPP
jgi:hypothetical protein